MVQLYKCYTEYSREKIKKKTVTTTSKAKPKDMKAEVSTPCCPVQCGSLAQLLVQGAFAHRRANTGRKEQTLTLASCAASVLEASVQDAQYLLFKE